MKSIDTALSIASKGFPETLVFRHLLKLAAPLYLHDFALNDFAILPKQSAHTQRRVLLRWPSLAGAARSEYVLRMPIPELDADGFLPEGVHECTLEEIRHRFGAFRKSDRRPQLFSRLQSFLSEAVKTGLVVAVAIDGSFVTGKAEPNDIDQVVEKAY